MSWARESKKIYSSLVGWTGSKYKLGSIVNTCTLNEQNYIEENFICLYHDSSSSISNSGEMWCLAFWAQLNHLQRVTPRCLQSLPCAIRQIWHNLESRAFFLQDSRLEYFVQRNKWWTSRQNGEGLLGAAFNLENSDDKFEESTDFEFLFAGGLLVLLLLDLHFEEQGLFLEGGLPSAAFCEEVCA